MLSELLVYAFLAALLFFLKELLITARRNHSAHQFFKKLSPNLPVVPNPGIFGGHINEISWVKRSWRQLEKYHNKLGKTYGFFYCDTPVVSTLDLDLVKAMVIDKPDDHLNRFKSNTPIEELEYDCLLTSDVDQWRRLRSAIAPAFTKSKMNTPNVEAEFKNVIDRTINAIEERLDRAKIERSEQSIKLNTDDMFLRYANALVFSSIYKQDNVIDLRSDKDHYTSLIEHVAKSSITPTFKFCVMFPTYIPIVNWLMEWFHPLGAMRRTIMNFIKQQTLVSLQAKQQIHQAKENFRSDKSQKYFDADNFLLKNGTKFRRNMIDYVTDQFHGGKLTKSEYLNNAFFLLLAAVKTSGDAISKMIYCLAANQDEQDKLRASVQAEGVESEYLQWIIHESLRLFPPAPFGCSRRLSYDLTTKDSLTIPAGTLVHPPVTLIHRLPEYWGQDADEFKPERWREASSFHPAQYLAFGIGKRKCLGAEFAMREIKMLMSELISRYRFKCPPETNAKTILEYDTYIVFTSSDSPVHIEISRL